MTAPYRDQATSLVQVQRGACPWCRAPVSFAASEQTAVCDRCGARYASELALATTQPATPAVVARPRIGYYALLTCIAAAGILLIPLAIALVVAGVAFAAGIYLGFGLPSFQTTKQLPARSNPDDETH